MAQVLVIENGRELRALLHRVLTDDGHEVVEADSGEQGLEFLTKIRFDVVVTDIFMPGTDGLKIIRWLRSTHHPAKIIAVSGGRAAIDVDILEVALKMGAHATFQKPFPILELCAAVRRVLE